jgi:hypothetical protein
MDLSKLLITGVVGVGLGILPDWFFTGVLFHEKYKAYPEVWRRPAGGTGENLAIACSVVLSFLTFFGFAYLYATFNPHTWAGAFRMAAIVWVTGPLPLIIGNALFVKTHPAIILSHSLGWLAKLCMGAIASAWILS